MTIINNGATKFTQAIADTMTYGRYGSGTTTEAFSDTGLETALGQTSKPLTVTRSGQSIIAVHDLSSTDANSLTLTEFEVNSGTSDPLTRVTTTEVVKTNTVEVTTTQTFYLDVN